MTANSSADSTDLLGCRQAMSTLSSDNASISQLLVRHRDRIEQFINMDGEFTASAARTSCSFGIKSSQSEEIFVFSVGSGHARVGTTETPDFILSARHQDWLSFFADPQPRFYHSYWSILRTFGHQAPPQEVCILGDQATFGRCARIWRLALDRTRDAVCGLRTEPASLILKADTSVPRPDIDPSGITGHYTLLHHPRWGPCPTFYETTGRGPQPLLLLHTAGADSRQNHAVMLQPALTELCTIYALDLPSHGRSYPIPNVPPQGYRLTEDDYVTCIALFLRKLNTLHHNSPSYKVIVCGASMAGHVCLALALRAAELDIGGVIPLEAAAHLPLTQPPYEVPHEAVNESVLNAERVYSMLGPGASVEARRCIWWTYSSQAAGVFQGDLAFYFGGWDGRGLLGAVDAKRCPVVMGTGEWDYSCTAEVGRETAEMVGVDVADTKGEATLVEGVRFETLEGLGHFPLTEDPVRMAAWLKEAVIWIRAMRAR